MGAVTLRQHPPPPVCQPHSFIFSASSFNKWKLNAYYVPGTVLRIRSPFQATDWSLGWPQALRPERGSHPSRPDG